MPRAEVPSEIRIRLGGRSAPNEHAGPALRQLVEEMVQRAYARARVTVCVDPALREDLVAVVGDEDDRHDGFVRKLVAFARRRSGRAGP